ncbi:MAG: Asp-tRNA(Asn)/Glu-tRNA(Gln) amidotransferase subunit GatC [Gammaproteobacteria bacterium]|nr:Asp-tRNA(Asn)/Glu-tRNA(Gln) amidotransferase subunit GatC [Gammaproteobacteria bacterium]
MDTDSIDIDHLARLAALRLNDSERPEVRADLQRIVAMVDRMQSVDTEGVAPLAHPLDASQRLRPDALTETVDRAHYQAGAPAVRDGMYIVPRVVE